MNDPLSLIFLPTLECNAECEYCFENKNTKKIHHAQLQIIFQKILQYMDETNIQTLHVHWQGGEIMMLPPSWYLQAYDIIQNLAIKKQKNIFHYCQTNLLGYNQEWKNVFHTMFHNSIGTSIDFPNVHRKTKHGNTEDYDRILQQNIQRAQQDNIQIGAIAVPNTATLQKTAQEFYDHFVHFHHLSNFQINTPFPGGEANKNKTILPIEQLIQFYQNLYTIWLQQGIENNIQILPFQPWHHYFKTGTLENSCVWQENCAKEFFCIDPQGNIAQCDCWVTSYPEFHYGNIFTDQSLQEILDTSKIRIQFLQRPENIIQNEDCIDCAYLGLCHGGCPIRTYTVYNRLDKKDPYCLLYKTIFQTIQNETIENVL